MFNSKLLVHQGYSPLLSSINKDEPVLTSINNRYPPMVNLGKLHKMEDLPKTNAPPQLRCTLDQALRMGGPGRLRDLAEKVTRSSWICPFFTGRFYRSSTIESAYGMFYFSSPSSYTFNGLAFSGTSKNRKLHRFSHQGGCDGDMNGLWIRAEGKKYGGQSPLRG